MVSPEEHPRDPHHGDPRGLPREEIHQRRFAGRIRVPPQVLAENDARAPTYEEWAHAARMLDREIDPKRNEADLYDEELVRNVLRELRERREDGTLRDVVFCMRADLIRNLGNMCNPQLRKDILQYSKIIQNPSYLELHKAANQGRRCTWEKLSAIKTNCSIELALDECVAQLNHMRRLKRSTERAAAGHKASTMKLSLSRRIPSWNLIAGESSNEDEVGPVASKSGKKIPALVGMCSMGAIASRRPLISILGPGMVAP